MGTSFTPIASLVGGVLIGLSATLVLATHGKIAGISSIFGGLLRREGDDTNFNVAFVLGLVATGALLRVFHPSFFPEGPTTTLGVAAIAGALVGFGTRLGGGCTSGHGVCGLSRFSGRSFVATLTFMALGGATVFVVRHVLGMGR